MSEFLYRRSRNLLAFLAMTLVATSARAQQKVIIDTDFTTAGDDGQVAVMAAQLHAARVIELLGITVVAGNEWLPQEVAEALRAVERLGIADAVGRLCGGSMSPGPRLQEPGTGACVMGCRRVVVSAAGAARRPADSAV
jgi:hypothetical protein